MITVHGFAMSPNTRRVLVALEEAGEPYTLEHVDLMSGAHREEGFRKLNPTARVPAVVVGDHVLWESNAVLVWLAERHPDRLFRGDTPEEKADVARFMFMNAAHLSPAVARIFAHTIRLPEDQRRPEIVTEARAEVERSLRGLEPRLAKQAWLGARFGIADISVALTLQAAPMLAIGFDAYPGVAAWRERIAARPAWKKVHAT